MTPLRPWMRYLLLFAGFYNVMAGATMLFARGDFFKALAIKRPDTVFFVQLVGILVALFGVGYWMVLANPSQNRGVMLLGFLSKSLGSVLGLSYVLLGKLTLLFLPVLFVSDIIYLPFFWMILTRLYDDDAIG